MQYVALLQPTENKTKHSGRPFYQRCCVFTNKHLPLKIEETYKLCWFRPLSLCPRKAATLCLVWHSAGKHRLCSWHFRPQRKHQMQRKSPQSAIHLHHSSPAITNEIPNFSFPLSPTSQVFPSNIQRDPQEWKYLLFILVSWGKVSS